MGWALFAYLPILVGYNAAREFGGSAALGGIAGMMCIANSAMPLLAPGAADPATAILLPLTNAQYNPAAGGMIAALIAGAFFAWMERQIRKVMPNALDTFLSPLLVLIIGAFALMLVIQPVGAWLTTAIFSVLTFIFEKLGVLGGYILSAGFLPLVSVGLHGGAHADPRYAQRSRRRYQGYQLPASHPYDGWRRPGRCRFGAVL